MFVISLTYTVPAEEVDVHLPAHGAWLHQGVAEGVLLATGRKVPRSGGMLFLRGDRETIDTYLASAPFLTEGVATVDAITELALGMIAPGLEALNT